MKTLAIHGGKPVRELPLPYGRQTITDEDIAEVVNVLRSSWLTTGPKVDEFEQAFARQVGASHAVSFNSGTAALHGAVFAAGLGLGDEAITSPLTFAASANCLLYQSATPVFADVNAKTLTLDPVQIEKRITPNTKAILPVDYAGHPSDLDKIRDIANRHNLIVIEDAAHAFGARYKGKRIGSLNDLTMFSMHPVKHITTGEGGIVTTDNAGFARRMRSFRNHGLTSDARERHQKGSWHYEMVDLGYNYRLPDIACALGLSQLKRIDSNLKRRREIAAIYKEAFSGYPGLLLPFVEDWAEPAWHLYPIRIVPEKLSVDRDEVMRALTAENIKVNVHYIPVHYHPYYRKRFGYKGGEYPVAEAAFASLISIPMFHGMSDQDVADVIEAVTKVLDAFS